MDKSVGKASPRNRIGALDWLKSRSIDKNILFINKLYDQYGVKHTIPSASGHLGGLCISFGGLAPSRRNDSRVIGLSCGAATLLRYLTRLPSVTGIWRRRALPSQSGPDGVVHPTPFFLWACTGTSEQAAGRHRHRFAMADHQVIEHAHPDQLQDIAQLVGDRTVGGAGFGDSGERARVG